MKRPIQSIIAMVIILFTLLQARPVAAQTLLNRSITLNVTNMPVTDVLELISNQGNFYFSYNSSIIRKDSLVTVHANNKPLKALLDQLFRSGYEFKESGNYIIIRRAPLQLTLVTAQEPSTNNIYLVSGYVRDDQTGEKLMDASVYEKTMLSSALTDRQGYFRIKLKKKYRQAALTVSKEFYEDTTVKIEAGYNQQVSITLSPADLTGQTVIISPGKIAAADSIYIEVPQPDSSSIIYLYKKLDSIRVQRTSMGRFLLSTRLKVQSINLGKFFTARPVQVSFTPGLSTNGKMNAQVINNFSFNILGGYSGGVNGFELGGLFNIDKKDVQYVQIGGLFNIVGGSMKGLQIGGISNTVLDSVGGFQIGGITNVVKGKYTGFQLGGIYNHVGKEMTGFQLAGITNFTNTRTTGMQLAGIANISSQETRGVQVSGIVNYTRKLKGVQIGLINIADTSEGYSIGLINVVLKGYHKLAFYATEVTPFNAAFKTGNHKLYSILMGGVHPDTAKRVVSFGYGIGSEWHFGKTLGLNAEASCQYVFLGSWDYLNLLNRATINFHVRIGKAFALFAGPVFNVYYSDQDVAFKGYRSTLPSSGYKTYDMGKNLTGWIGWNAGIHIF
ncbi:carboxypeptidase-like regulatory domain-containing protein [Flavihumibacter rivuli]|uniref:STN and carboxypeptidase regulatory-like domain-containing protein n=1 Tax=Flavihumibacter rivuli TaxID=2838156 RepID=UPI001BDDD4A7|nr:STN and carboxypeptidase regulatory-like domain-containing protein [Flavihumibacter rivuli]ULQ57186.1 carboxypeptidase-like regulatory domain-containing protein [Flavihumibacter rivuli]